MNCDNYIPMGCEGDDPLLLCPVCGHEYVHPVGLSCRSPGTENGLVHIDAHGIALDPHQPPKGRGTEVTLRFVGECGHVFGYVLQFHKGLTLLSRFMGEQLDTTGDGPQTIWRS